MHARYPSHNGIVQVFLNSHWYKASTMIARGEESKTIENYYESPEALKGFKDLIDEVTGTATWIGESNERDLPQYVRLGRPGLASPPRQARGEHLNT